LQENIVQRITQKIESVWARSDLDPDFDKALHLALPIFNSTSDAYQNFVHWMILPNLCCQAAGGQSHWADDITAAWLLYYIGAHIMDSIEDQDPPDEWWKVKGSGVALNIASAFYFSASAALQDLYKQEQTQDVANEIIADFNFGFLKMCEGQQNDLVQTRPTLQQYWTTAGAKSGTFFSIASRSGARLATRDASRIENFSKFGYHLGVLIQILDDLEDLDPQNFRNLFSNRAQLYRTLTFVYAREVSSQEELEMLESYFDSEIMDEHLSSDVTGLLDKCGAGIYILAEIQKHQERAIGALFEANPISPAKEMLTAKLEELGTI
jgi:geranylgeranyl pyrophosphate synthase